MDNNRWDKERAMACEQRSDRQEVASTGQGLGLHQYGNAIGTSRSCAPGAPGAPGELVASLASLDEMVETALSGVYALLGRLSPISAECADVVKTNSTGNSRVTEVGRRLAIIENRVYTMKVDVQSALARLEI